MKLGEPVEWALHCCTLLAVLPDGRALPAARLAEFHGVPGAYLAKSLQALSQAGIVEAVPGRRGGYRLGRPAGEVTLLQVVEAVEGDEGSFRCTEIRRRGPTASPAREYRHACAIAAAMDRADAAWRAELARQTLRPAGAARPGHQPGRRPQGGDLDAGGSAMRVFIAGATGAIGRFALPGLVGAGHEVTALARSDGKARAAAPGEDRLDD